MIALVIDCSSLLNLHEKIFQGQSNICSSCGYVKSKTAGESQSPETCKMSLRGYYYMVRAWLKESRITPAINHFQGGYPMNSFRAFCFVSLSVIFLALASGCIPPLTPEQQEIIDELNQRDLPAWYDESKFGIFIHWGPYAVPAFAPIEGSINDALANHYGDFLLHMPYVEWYWNALQTEGSATHQYHVENYGEDYSYDNFGRIFREGINEWNPDEWADLFDTAGARYVVLVTKHHDGFLMWPSEQINPNKQDWYSERDIVGELAHAVRERGMRFGVYYSGGLDWAWNERSARNIIDLAASMPIDAGYLHYVETHFRELIDRYEPSVLWNDINYPSNEGLWEMERDYYEAVPEGVVNDRFMVLAPIIKWLKFPFLRNFLHNLLRYLIIIGGNDLAALEGDPPPHCDFRTLEYVAMEDIREDKVEVTRGMGFGFGYNRMEPRPYMCRLIERSCPT